MELVQIVTVFLLVVVTVTLIVISIKLTDLLAENRSLRLSVQNIEADELFVHGNRNQQARQVQQQRQEEMLQLLREIAKQLSQRQPADPHRGAADKNSSSAAISRIGNS